MWECVTNDLWSIVDLTEKAESKKYFRLTSIVLTGLCFDVSPQNYRNFFPPDSMWMCVFLMSLDPAFWGKLGLLSYLTGPNLCLPKIMGWFFGSGLDC